MGKHKCEACNDLGHLEVCIGSDPDGSNEKWERQWCQDCVLIEPDYDPPVLGDY